MTHLLIIDLETSAIDPAQGQIVEVGAVLFDAVAGVPLATKAALVRAESNAAEAVNGIPTPVLAGPWTIAEERVESLLSGMAKLAPEPPIWCAHNAAFDRSWLPAYLGERWICTYSDAVWPKLPNETGSLTAIALAYGVGVVRAHRAIEDCLTLAAVLQRVHELEGGLDAWLARALESKRELVAIVSFEQKDLAKQAGFQWDPARKLWTRKVGESRAAAFAEGLPFKVRGL